MCKQYTLVYECGHRIYRKESICNRRTVFPHGKSEAACRGTPVLQLKHKGDCSRCRFLHASEELAFNVEACRIGILEMPQADIDEWAALESQRIRQALPPVLKQRSDINAVKTSTAWQSRKRSKRRTSLLGNEVLPENVVGPESWDVDYSKTSTIDTSELEKGWAATWDVDVIDESLLDEGVPQSPPAILNQGWNGDMLSD